MKTNLPVFIAALLGTTVLGLGIANPLPASAQTTLSPSTGLPYGADEVLKLSRAGVNEQIIITYIETSGSVYDLRPANIVYLRDQGVSDRVVNTMLDQRRKTQNTTPTVTPEPAAAQTPPAPAATPLCPTRCEWCGGPAVTYFEPTPVSTVHVIPYPAARAAYYGSYARFGPYRYYSSSYYGPSYYGRWGQECGWWRPACGHWHGCAHRLHMWHR